jgi:hypothetical protein
MNSSLELVLLPQAEAIGEETLLVELSFRLDRGELIGDDPVALEEGAKHTVGAEGT